MAIYPKAIRKLIPPGSNDPKIKPVGVVYHVAVSTSDSLHDLFTHDGGIESHFYVRFDGTVEQYRDTAFEADAQAAGNSWGTPREGMLSIETEGMGSGTWTDAQVQTLKDLTVWAAKTHGFKIVKAAGPFTGGVGYHAMFPEWNPNAHSCPGPDRIKQFDGVFVPWFKHALDPVPTPPQPSHALDVWFYNLRVGRDQAQVSAEVHAMLAEGPAILGLCEAVGYTLPKVAGYELIRDRSNQSRADIACYVSHAVGIDKLWWDDLKETWPQVKHDGTHAARSLLVVKPANGWLGRLVVGQVPQKPLKKFGNATNKALIAARAECQAALASLIAPSPLTHPIMAKRPTLAILDWNGIAPDVSKNIKGVIADATHIDTAVGRGVCFTGVHYPRTVGGVELKSDHKHALRFTVTAA